MHHLGVVTSGRVQGGTWSHLLSQSLWINHWPSLVGSKSWLVFMDVHYYEHIEGTLVGPVVDIRDYFPNSCDISLEAFIKYFMVVVFVFIPKTCPDPWWGWLLVHFTESHSKSYVSQYFCLEVFYGGSHFVSHVHWMW